MNLVKRSDKFKRWMIASFFLIPLVLFGSIAGYYVYTPVKMRVLIRLLAYDKTHFGARDKICQAGDRAIPYLIGSFASQNERVQSESFSVLVTPTVGFEHKRFSLEALVPYFLKALRSRNRNVRCYSAQVFTWLAQWEIGDRKPLPRVIEVLSEVTEVEPSAAHFLRILRENCVVPELIKLLSDPDVEVRRTVVYVLGEIGDKTVVPELIKILSDPDVEVRGIGAYVLGNIGDESALPGLIKLLSDPQKSVRCNAARALGKIGSVDSVGPLIAWLKQVSNSQVRRRDIMLVTWALERITGQSFGDVEKASLAQRQEIIQKWLNWWEENKGKYE